MTKNTEYIKFKKVNPTHYARKKVKEALEVLPARWRTLFLWKHPEYDNPEGKAFINRVANSNTADLRVANLLEEIAREYKQKQSA